MPRRFREDQAGAWHHHTLRTPGLTKCVRMDPKWTWFGIRPDVGRGGTARVRLCRNYSGYPTR